MAALLACHRADEIDAAVAVAGPPLLGPANLQDPRHVMREGLPASPALATFGLGACTPLCVLHGSEDEVVSPRCAEQLAEQACAVLTRSHGPLTETAGVEGSDWRAGGRLLLRRRTVPGLGHAWSGGPGGHAQVQRGGAPLVSLVLDFLRAAG